MPLIDEDLPKKKKNAFEIGEDLAALSVAELEERIVLLGAEISRIEDALKAKRMSADRAQSFFKA